MEQQTTAGRRSGLIDGDEVKERWDQNQIWEQDIVKTLVAIPGVGILEGFPAGTRARVLDVSVSRYGVIRAQILVLSHRVIRDLPVAHLRKVY